MNDDPPEDEPETPNGERVAVSKQDGEKKKISWEMVGLVASIFAGRLPAWVAKVLLASYEKLLNKETGDAPTTRPRMPAEDD